MVFIIHTKILHCCKYMLLIIDAVGIIICKIYWSSSNIDVSTQSCIMDSKVDKRVIKYVSPAQQTLCYWH